MKDRPLLTIRVSHTSGRTWGETRRFYGTDNLPPVQSITWPPCECPRCEPARERERQALRAALRILRKHT